MTAFLWKGAIYTSASQMPVEGRLLLVERGLAEPFFSQQIKPLGQDEANDDQDIEPLGQGEPDDDQEADDAQEAWPSESEYLADDLTEISGLGQSRQTRLNQIGILTFRDLAEADRDVVESLEGVTRTMATAWIAEAISITESM